jgi:hypothetical protein
MVEVVSIRPSKPFTWSFSRLKNYETCPKRHWHIDIQKDVQEEGSEHLKWGNVVHTGAAKRIAKGEPLPKGCEYVEPWAVRILTPPFDKILVEQKLAIREDFTPCGYFDKGVWFRTVVDVLKINGPVAWAGDWKTGGNVQEDSVQLGLSAQCVFSHHPEVMAIRTEFIWLQHGFSTPETFKRDDMPALWKGLWPRIETLKQAWTTASYPPKPGRLCRKWCPVQACPHWGE